jgi:plastocyanin
MSDSRWRRFVRNLVLVAVPGAALLSFGVVSGFAADKTIETAGSIGSYHWNPNNGSISTNGTVEFKNSDGTHGLVFDSPPATPSCDSGIPATQGANWHGTCTFTQPGTYNFHCPVHPIEMTGTITVTGVAGPEAPTVSTEPATNVGETGATLNGKVNPHGQATTYWFEWGLSESYEHESPTHESLGFSDSLSHSKSEPLTGLTPATTYHYTIVANNATGTTEGIDHTFRTPGLPTATTEPATGIGGAEATLVGKVNPNAQPNAKYFFKWGETEAYGHTTPEESAGTGTTPVSKSKLVTGLSPNTTYHFRIVVKYPASATPVEGLDKEFTTLNVPPPLATTGSATGISSTGATVEGTVNAHGQTTTYFFNYGQTPSYGAKTAEVSIGKGTSDQGVSALLAELLPDTTYHYQLVAHSAGGTTPGADQTLTTSSVVVPPQEEEQRPPPPPPPPAEEATPPDTKIAPKPPAKTHDRTPTIKFSASVGGASFQCSVDSKPFKACRSPFTAPSLKPGRHKIRVKAVAGGVSDPTPASYSFKVLAKKK